MTYEKRLYKLAASQKAKMLETKNIYTILFNLTLALKKSKLKPFIESVFKTKVIKINKLKDHARNKTKIIVKFEKPIVL